MIPRFNPHIKPPQEQHRVELASPPERIPPLKASVWARVARSPVSWGAVGVGLLVVPFALKTAAGWPTATGTKPEVISPGSTVRVWSSEWIRSVGGHWRCAPEATIQEEGTSRPLPATSSSEDWGNSIQVEERDTGGSFRPWVDVLLPNEATLVNTQVDIHVNAKLIYPVQEGNEVFSNVEQRITFGGHYPVASSWAAPLYHISFWLGLVGAAWVLGCEFCQWVAVQRSLNSAPRPRVEHDPELLEPDE